MQTHRYLRGILLWGMCAGLLAPAYGKTRIALVGATRLDREQAAIELAEAELTKDADLVLVDRHEVAELLAEQDLSRMGAMQEQHAIQVGRILEASIFAVLESVEQDKAPWQASVFDARTGEMLANVMLAADKEVLAMAAGFAGAVRNGLARYNTPREERKPVAIMAIRNADLGGMWDSWCMGIGRLIELAVLDTPGTTLLNRRHLEWVNRETDLQGVAADLTSSTVRLSLEARRGNSTGSVRVIMRAEDAAGNTLTTHDVRHADMDAAVIARDLANAFRSWITGEDVDIPLFSDPLAEAWRYMADAEYYMSHVAGQDSRVAAYGAAEAALALAPHDEPIIDRAIHVFTRLLEDDDLFTIWRCIELSRQMHLRPIERQEMLEARLGNLLNSLFGHLQRLQYEVNRFEQSGFCSGSGPDYLQTREQHDDLVDAIDATRRRLADWVLDTVMAYYYSRTAPPPPRRAISDNINFLTPRMHWFHADSRIWNVVTKGHPLLLDELNERHIILGWVRREPRSFARLLAMATQRDAESTENFLRKPTEVFPSSFGISDGNRRDLQPLFEKMIQHADPAVRAYGQLGVLVFARYQDGLDDAELAQRMEDLRDTFREQILTMDKHPPARYREALYGAERDMIDFLIQYPEERDAWLLDQFDFMLANRHISFWTIFGAIDTEQVRFRHYFPHWGRGMFAGSEFDPFVRQTFERPVSEYPVLLQRTRRVLDLHASGDYVTSEMHSIPFMHGSFQREIEAMEQKLLALQPKQHEKPATWKQSIWLYSSVKRSEEVLAVVGLRGQHLYVVARPDKKADTLRIMRIPLDGSAPRFWGKPFTWPSPLERSTGAAFCESGGVFYWAGSTFVHVPSDTATPVFWTPASGYPAENISAVGDISGTLFVALEGGYLFGRRDTDTAWQLIASARRKFNSESGLDGIWHAVRSVIPDPARNRVLLLVSATGSEEIAAKVAGIWCVDAQTLSTRQILGMHRYIYDYSIMPDERIAVRFSRSANRSFNQYTHEGVFVFSPQTDTTVITHEHDRIGVGLGPDVEYAPFIGPLLYRSAKIMVPGNGRLWLHEHVIEPDGQIIRLPDPPPIGKHTYRLTGNYLAVPDSDAILMLSHRGRQQLDLYLLELEQPTNHPAR